MQHTGLYLGLLALLYIGLSFKVIGFRRSLKVGIGDGDHKELKRAIRVHANFMEYVPLAMLLYMVAEQNNLSSMFLHIIGAVLVICRAFHAQGLLNNAGTSWQRFAGTLGTFIVILTLAIYNIVQFI